MAARLFWPEYVFRPGKTLSALEESNQTQDTVVVYTSDHGDMMGDQGYWTKQVMYDASAGVPMIAAGPGVPVGSRVSSVRSARLGLVFWRFCGFFETGYCFVGVGGKLWAGGPAASGRFGCGVAGAQMRGNAMSYLDDKTPIDGTILFDGEMAHKGYGLNKMCYSFNSAAAREEFKKDEAAYCAKFDLNAAQTKAVIERDILGLLYEGGSIYYLAKFAGLLGLNMQDIGALQTGMTLEEFKAKLVAAGK